MPQMGRATLLVREADGIPGTHKVINAAYHAFGTGLHAVLYLSAGLVIAAGILTAITLRSSARPDAPTSDPAESG